MFSKPIVLAGFLSVVAIALLTALGLPPGHSATFNYAWSAQYAEALSWLNPLPRYLPGLWAGFGGYDFFFYAPLPFWFIATFVDPLCPNCAHSTEFVLGSSLFLVASGFSMFAFLRSFFAAKPAMLGALLYVVLPYHLLVDWFSRQAAGEFSSYAFIPLAALGIERIRRNERGAWILALGVAGTMLSHLPTALLVAHAFACLILVFVALEPGRLAARTHLFSRFVGFGMLGLALASFYWLPAVLLLDTVSPDALFDPYFEAWRWLFGPGSAQPNPAFATVVLASFLACLPFLLGSMLVARGPLLAWILVPTVFAIAMNTTFSEPIWRAWIIAKVQFPWRLMTVIDFATAIAAAALAEWMIRRVRRLVLSAVLLLAVVPVAFVAGSVKFTLPDAIPIQSLTAWSAASEYLSPEMTVSLSNRLGLPEIGLFQQDAIVKAFADMASQFPADRIDGEILDRQPRSLTVRAPEGAAVLSLPVQYWFLWRAETASGSPLEIRANPTFGTLDIIGPAGGFSDEPVIVSLSIHPSESVGGAISLLALLALLFCARKRGPGKA